MLKKASLAVALCLLLLGPTVAITGVAVLATPGTESAGAGCLSMPAPATSDPISPAAPVPKRARAWIALAARTCKDLPQVWIAAVIYQESGFRPAVFSDDVNGGTWGLFQINRYEWRKVYGEWEDDRNHNGIWDIKEPVIHARYGAKYLCDLLRLVRERRRAHPEWPSTKQLSELDALVVAHNGGPGRLATYPRIAPVTRKYLRDVRRHMKEWADPNHNSGGASQPSSRVVMPMVKGSYRITSRYGMRKDPFGPGRAMHWGTDFAASDGTAILAVADGTVVRADMVPGDAGTIDIVHNLGGGQVATRYKHMWKNGIHVRPGDKVQAGQHIADVGSSGHSTGPHLHLEVRPGGPGHPRTDPQAWLEQHHAKHLRRPGAPADPDAHQCGKQRDQEQSREAGAPRPFTGRPGGRLPDPTGTSSRAFITRQTSHLISETKRAFPHTSWGCWYASNNPSEHPRGLACDLTFGNHLGEFPTKTQVAQGWKVAHWLKKYAKPLRVKYLIWQRKIWSQRHNAKGWRIYNGGGLADPTTPTGGHYDHLHISQK